jgi:hypothetical protein
MMIQAIITQKLRKDANGNYVFVLPKEESEKINPDKLYTATIMGPFSKMESKLNKQIIKL